MKNALLLSISIFIALCMAEVVLRGMHLGYHQDPYLNGSPVVFSQKGYWLNPSEGVDQPLPQLKDIQYHFYPPHLRDTPVNRRAIPILVLGDSFTFGWLLPWKQTYVAKLQNYLDETLGKNKYQLLNAATGGWGTADYLTYLEEFGFQMEPKFVVVFLNTDDIGRSIKRNIYVFSNKNSMELINNFHALPSVTLKEKLYSTWLFKHSVLIHFIHYKIAYFLRKTTVGDKNITQSEHPIPASSDIEFDNAFAISYGEALFLRMNAWCKQHHAKLLIITTGFNAFYPANQRDPTKVFIQEAKSFFAKENIAYYDIAISFKERVNGKLFQIPDDQHPNELATSAIAQLTGSWIKNQIKG